MPEDKETKSVPYGGYVLQDTLCHLIQRNL